MRRTTSTAERSPQKMSSHGDEIGVRLDARHPCLLEARLGHSSIAITANIYGHLSVESQRRTADTMAGLLTARLTVDRPSQLDDPQRPIMMRLEHSPQRLPCAVLVTRR